MRSIDDTGGGEYIPPVIIVNPNPIIPTVINDPANNNVNTNPISLGAIIGNIINPQQDTGGGVQNPIDTNAGAGVLGGGAIVRDPVANNTIDVVPTVTNNPATPILAPLPTNTTNPVTNITNGVSNIVDQVKATATTNPLLVYGGIALVVYLLMKKK